MKPRKSLTEMASPGTEPKQIAGHPADQCPFCGCTLFVDGVHRGEKEITRYIECRNQNCGKRFLSYQPAAKILREIEKPEPPQPTHFRDGHSPRLLREVG